MDAEVLVVGAGPAGSSAAYHLARLNRRVRLLDSARFPRDKSCGDGLTRSATRLLAEMGVLEQFAGAQKVMGTRVFMKGRGTRAFLYPDGRGSPHHGLVVPRAVLDHALCRHAVATGAELWESTHVTRLTRVGNVNRLLVTCNGAERVLEAPVIVAADGAASALAIQTGLTNRVRRSLGFALRAYFEEIDDLGDLLEIYLPLTDPSDRFIQPSYGWVFPTGPGSANIGVGIFERGRDATVRQLVHFLEFLRSTDVRFKRMRQVHAWRGAPLNSSFLPVTA